MGAAAWTRRFAPAKVNLFLHVGPVGADGYHPVCSLMVFADVGDTVRLRDHPEMTFRTEGPFAAALGDDPDNLVVRARDRLIAVLPRPPPPFELVLEKILPIAAGLGGGSADAAATLRLIVERALPAGGPSSPIVQKVQALARDLGADVAACVASKSVIGRGRGDELDVAPPMPALHAVLVNPRAPSSTGAVYRAFDALPGGPGANEPPFWGDLSTLEDVVDLLNATRNDLQTPAVALQPLIGEVLSALAAASETRFARMSGSGATCFALCAGEADARRLALRLASERPDWWTTPCRLGGSA